MRKAVELLVNRGRLEVIPSKGTFVCTKVPRLRKHCLIGIVGASGTGCCREMLFERLNAFISDSGYKCMDIANNPRLFLRIRAFCFNFLWMDISFSATP
ncbi:MAG: hypothetical protein V8T87_09205 [Victivallales bacterium]